MIETVTACLIVFVNGVRSSSLCRQGWLRMHGMLHQGGSIHRAKPSASGPIWWHVPRWRRQEQQSTQRRWLVMCLALPCLTGQHVTRASLHVTGAFLSVTWGFPARDWGSSHEWGCPARDCSCLACDWGFLACDWGFLHVSWGFLHVSWAFLHACLIGLAVHVRQSLNLIVCVSVWFYVCLVTPNQVWHCHISGISARHRKADVYVCPSDHLPV